MIDRVRVAGLVILSGFVYAALITPPSPSQKLSKQLAGSSRERVRALRTLTFAPPAELHRSPDVVGGWLVDTLRDNDATVRYWAIEACRQFPETADQVLPELRRIQVTESSFSLRSGAEEAFIRLNGEL